MGDSRIRALYGAALTVAYQKDTKIHRYLDDLHPQTISIHNVTASNYAMAQRLGGLQKDMWTYKVAKKVPAPFFPVLLIMIALNVQYQEGFSDSRSFEPQASEDKDDRRFFLRPQPGSEK